MARVTDLEKVRGRKFGTRRGNCTSELYPPGLWVGIVSESAGGWKNGNLHHAVCSSVARVAGVQKVRGPKLGTGRGNCTSELYPPGLWVGIVNESAGG